MTFSPEHAERIARRVVPGNRKYRGGMHLVAVCPECGETVAVKFDPEAPANDDGPRGVLRDGLTDHLTDLCTARAA